MKPGDLVGIYSAERQPALALIVEVRSGKALLRFALDRSTSSRGVPLRELSSVAPAADWPSSALEEALRAAPLSGNLLATAWTEQARRPEPQQPLDLPQFTRLLHGQPQAFHLAAAWLALAGAQDLFRLRKGEILWRHAQDLRLLRRDRRRQALVQQAQTHFLQLIRQRQPLPPPLPGSPQAQQLELLDSLAAAGASGDPAAQLPVDLAQALRQAGWDGSHHALRPLLVDLGRLPEGQPLGLLGSAWAASFPSDCLAAAEELLLISDQPQPGDAGRRELSQLRAFSIDDADTQEVDDALSLEQLEDGRQRLWVHVADPHRLIQPDSILDLEARRRSTTLYLSAGLRPMVPLALGAGPLSLTAGQRRAAVSVALELSAEGEVLHCEILRSWIRVTYALTYADADELIELAPPEDPDLAQLEALLRRRRHWREQRGALAMEQAEGRLFREAGALALEISEPGPARQLVAEAMILAGSAVAAWAEGQGLAMPFRCQEGNSSLAPEALQAFPIGPVRWANQRLGLGRSRIHAQAGPHSALGLPAYLQWTSPIRRYGDLLAHRQWLHHSGAIPGEPLAAPALGPWLEALDRLGREANQIAREDQRLALLQWLEATPGGVAPQEGLLLRWLRADEGLALVRLDAWAMELPVRLQGQLQPGDRLLVQLEAVAVDQDLLRLTGIAG